jgi:hypothetical protein
MKKRRILCNSDTYSYPQRVGLIHITVYRVGFNAHESIYRVDLIRIVVYIEWV